MESLKKAAFGQSPGLARMVGAIGALSSPGVPFKAPKQPDAEDAKKAQKTQKKSNAKIDFDSGFFCVLCESFASSASGCFNRPDSLP
ncbi:MAG: hypothetical protein JSS17_12520 [Proteobacteria bacterium]|nr:hypothetical protein [Pseudomonadota bacterium]